VYTAGAVSNIPFLSGSLINMKLKVGARKYSHIKLRFGESIKERTAYEINFFI
jgi:hypothetical protein